LLEDAARELWDRLEGLEALELAALDHDNLAGLDLPHHLGFDQVQGRGLGGEDPGLADLAQPERPEAVGVPRGDGQGGREEQEGVGAFHLAQALDDRVLDRALGARQQVYDDLGVRRGLEDRAALFQPRLDLQRVGQIAVVGDGDGPVDVAEDQGLGVLEVAGAGRGVAHVTDGGLAGQALELGLGEDLGDQPHPDVGLELAPPGGHDAGGLLAAVLEGEEAEVGQLRGLRMVGDAEDAAHSSR
jgi:hypothetical protein